MTNLYFPTSALFCSVLMVVHFFSKKRIKNKETDLYKILILSNLFEVISAFAVILLSYLFKDCLAVYVFNRIDFICLLLWVWSFFLIYTMLVLKKKKKLIKNII